MASILSRPQWVKIMVTSHYLNQWWPSLLTHTCVTCPQWVKEVSFKIITWSHFDITGKSGVIHVQLLKLNQCQVKGMKKWNSTWICYKIIKMHIIAKLEKERVCKFLFLNRNSFTINWSGNFNSLRPEQNGHQYLNLCEVMWHHQVTVS